MCACLEKKERNVSEMLTIGSSGQQEISDSIFDDINELLLNLFNGN